MNFPLVSARTVLPAAIVAAGLVALSLRLTAGAAAGDPEMAADCDAASAGIQTHCRYDVGQTFSVQVHATKLPPGGYIAFQAKLRWADESIEYLPAADASSEFLWPDCGIPARISNQSLMPLGADPAGSNSALHGCVVGIGAEASTFAGPVIQVQLRCDAAGSVSLTLAPHPGDPQLGSHFIDDQQNEVDPVLRGAVLGCGVPADGEPLDWTPGMETRSIPTSTSGERAVLSVDCNDSLAGIQTRCSYASGETFSIAVHLTALARDASGAELPYYGWLVTLGLGDALAYQPAASPGDELLAPPCGVLRRQQEKERAAPGVAYFMWLCYDEPLVPSTERGPLFKATFRCSRDGAWNVGGLVRGTDGSWNLAHADLIDAFGWASWARLQGSDVVCGALSAPTATAPPTVAEPTTSPTPTPTPLSPPAPEDWRLGQYRTGGELALDCDATAAGVQSRCRYTPGETFSVQLHVIAAPEGGYTALQTKVRWVDSVIEYLPDADVRVEFLWPECGIAARANNEVPWAGSYQDPSVLHGCVVGIGQGPSSYAAAAIQVELRCESGGESPLDIVQPFHDPQLGTHFIDSTQALVLPLMHGAVVGCGVEPEGEATVWTPPGWTSSEPGPLPPAPLSPPQPLSPPVDPRRTVVAPTVEVDCDAAMDGVQWSCQYATGEAFWVQVDLTRLARLRTEYPGGGLEEEPLAYWAYQVKLFWEGAVDYSAATDKRAEILWPGCSMYARTDHRPAQSSAAWACGSEPGIAAGETGPLLEIAMQCTETGQARVVPVPGWWDQEQGTFFWHLTHPGPVSPAVVPAHIGCGEPASPAVAQTTDRLDAPLPCNCGPAWPPLLGEPPAPAPGGLSASPHPADGDPTSQTKGATRPPSPAPNADGLSQVAGASWNAPVASASPSDNPGTVAGSNPVRALPAAGAAPEPADGRFALAAAAALLLSAGLLVRLRARRQ